MLRMTYTTTLADKHRFPPDTHGFLYFHPDAHNPLESQIRFRVTHDRDPTHGFASGHDLADRSGYIWHIPVEHLTKAPTLREMLLRDGLVDDALFAQLQARAGSRTRPRRLKRGITSLSQPFTLEFNKKTFHLIARVAEQDRMYKTAGLLRFYTEHDRYLVYKAGSGLCRLERSDLPQHAGRRIVVMRLLKILQPPKLRSDLPPTCSVSVPAEGELFKFGQRVWYRDVDKPGQNAEVLRLLYDAPDDGEQAFGQSL
ncbi:hypothetical protein EWM64_g6612 [Hericium alpestre]|uniref:Uncharacterized protein n=1 Tax=Hericium alpestre TaxID=135208 RepID=A0A4Y9ZRJ5_9AGAM|nr:hypothetical protein EWM64_g6612 [Hericium alpestre]